MNNLVYSTPTSQPANRYLRCGGDTHALGIDRPSE